MTFSYLSKILIKAVNLRIQSSELSEICRDQLLRKNSTCQGNSVTSSVLGFIIVCSRWDEVVYGDIFCNGRFLDFDLTIGYFYLFISKNDFNSSSFSHRIYSFDREIDSVETKFQWERNVFYFQKLHEYWLQHENKLCCFKIFLISAV